MYKNLFSEERRKIFKILAYVSSVLVFGFLLLTIIFWDDSYVGVILLFTTLSFLVLLFYFAVWRTNSDRFIRLKAYIDSSSSDSVLRNLFEEHIKLNDFTLWKQHNFKHVGLTARSYNGESDYFIWLTDKNTQFLVEFTEDNIKYFYGDKNIDEQDIDEWIQLDRNNFIDKTYAQVVLIIVNLYKERKKNDTAN